MEGWLNSSADSVRYAASARFFLFVNLGQQRDFLNPLKVHGLFLKLRTYNAGVSMLKRIHAVIQAHANRDNRRLFSSAPKAAQLNYESARETRKKKAIYTTK